MNIISDLLSLLFILFMFFVAMKLYDYGNHSPLEKSYERHKMLKEVDYMLDNKHLNLKLDTNDDYIRKLEVELDNELQLLYQYRIELLEKQIEINNKKSYKNQKDVIRLYKKIKSLYYRIIQKEIKRDNHYELICRKDSLKDNKK